MAKDNAKPLRTVLFCADTEEAEINAAYTSGADSIVIDLEEPKTPFPPREQERARQTVKSFLGVDRAQGGPAIDFRPGAAALNRPDAKRPARRDGREARRHPGAQGAKSRRTFMPPTPC